jgi:hypothetical protein
VILFPVLMIAFRSVGSIGVNTEYLTDIGGSTTKVNQIVHMAINLANHLESGLVLTLRTLGRQR